MQEFPQLVSLYIDHIDDNDATTLAQLTRLQELVVGPPNDLTEKALYHLSDLSQLTFCSIYAQEEYDMDSPMAIRWNFENKVSGVVSCWSALRAVALAL